MRSGVIEKVDRGEKKTGLFFWKGKDFLLKKFQAILRVENEPGWEDIIVTTFIPQTGCYRSGNDGGRTLLAFKGGS
jgi:hypothetical protein